MKRGIQKLKNSLLLQLALLGTGILVLMLAAFSITTWYYRQTMRANTIASNEKILLQIDDRMAEFYDRMQRVATAMVYSPTTYSYFAMDATARVLSSEDIEAVFSNTVLLEGSIDGICLYDSNMNRIASIGNGLDVLPARQALKTGVEFSNLFYTENGGVPHYAIYFPAYDLKSPQYGIQVGMSVLLMKADSFDDMLVNTQTTPHTQLFLIDAKGNSLASVGGPAHQPFTADMLTTSKDYYVQIHNTKMQGWRVVSRIPTEELNNMQDSVNGFLIAAYLLAFVMLALMIWFSYRRFVSPMRQMDAFLKKLLTEPDARLKAVRADEIGNVINSLDHLLDEQKRMNGELQQSRERVYKAELAKKQLQILAYRNQINPHFLYNTFDCIRGMALYHDEEDIAEITMALSHVFRFAIKGANVVTVAEEVSYIREYATIIAYRFRGKIDISVDMADSVQDKHMIKLMLQPLVENAVFHGLEQQAEGGDIDVNITQNEPGRLKFVVADTGCGIPPERLTGIRNSLAQPGGQNGIGMANIYQRLKLFYGDAAAFTIESEMGKGTTITIVVPDDVKEGKSDV